VVAAALFLPAAALFLAAAVLVGGAAALVTTVGLVLVMTVAVASVALAVASTVATKAGTSLIKTVGAAVLAAVASVVVAAALIATATAAPASVVDAAVLVGVGVAAALVVGVAASVVAVATLLIRVAFSGAAPVEGVVEVGWASSLLLLNKKEIFQKRSAKSTIYSRFSRATRQSSGRRSRTGNGTLIESLLNGIQASSDRLRGSQLRPFDRIRNDRYIIIGRLDGTSFVGVKLGNRSFT
jgi:hypothetical protein